jgi:hypothetical protein
MTSIRIIAMANGCPDAPRDADVHMQMPSGAVKQSYRQDDDNHATQQTRVEMRNELKEQTTLVGNHNVDPATTIVTNTRSSHRALREPTFESPQNNIANWQLQMHLPWHLGGGGRGCAISSNTFDDWCAAVEHFAMLAGLDDAGIVGVALKALHPTVFRWAREFFRESYDVDLEAVLANGSFGLLDWRLVKEVLYEDYAGLGELKD